MVLKIVKAIWFLSLLVVTAVFLYTYASLPETVVLLDRLPPVSVSREEFFYSMMVVLALVNTIAVVARRIFSPSASAFLTWLHGLLVCLNVFFVIALSYVNLYNSLEKFDYARLGAVVYGSVLLIVFWALAWPAFLLYKNFSAKEPV